MSVRDAHGTRGKTSGAAVVVERHVLPSARFVTRDHSCFIAHLKNHSLQLELVGVPPFFFELDGRAFEHAASALELPITGPGVFAVRGLRDRFCGGAAAETVLHVHEMPHVSVEGNSVVCEGDVSKIVFRITGGAPPYLLSYTEDGSPETTVSVAGNTLEIVPKQQGALVYATGLADRYCFFGRSS